MADSQGTRRALRRRVRAGERLLLVVAGPNGAGKSTFVETFLKPTGILVVNPDDVAKGLSPDTPEAIAYEAARVADTWRRDLVARGVSFCMETVFSKTGRNLLKPTDIARCQCGRCNTTIVTAEAHLGR
jgi:predicted ABC-type ATPase